ncbi:isoprenylcysteine carboxyl methyltransferase family protein [Streptosporangium sp. LJ11]|uniref:isoprenylcysteine carboxyl methyltransferase family protein n=1 Tax=Streptosporangium sp. LJ11 TaxID=3436927 RepID=UPI003F7B0453
MSWHLSSWYLLLVLLVGLERVAELVVARRNARWSMARGGVLSGQGHYPWMVALHTGLLAGCLFEAGLADRPFVPALGWPMLVLVVAAQGLRWWCITALGPQWNTQVIVVPGLPLVERGPYRLRWLRHPNYVAVAVEGAALPLVHTAWVTALVFTVLNAALMVVRIRCEEDALASLATAPATGAAGAAPPQDVPPPTAPPEDLPPSDVPPSSGRAPA